jgi:hypothetical protein
LNTSPIVDSNGAFAMTIGVAANITAQTMAAGMNQRGIGSF